MSKNDKIQPSKKLTDSLKKQLEGDYQGLIHGGKLKVKSCDILNFVDGV